MSLALCIIGCGHFAKEFATAVQFSDLGDKRSGIELFFASRDRKKAQDYCQMFNGTDSFGSYETAAGDPRVHALYLCTPHHLHLHHALLAARYGKHILVEKPIARTQEEAEQMIMAARDAGIKLMVAENYRYMEVVQYSRQLLSQGTIGTLRLVQIQDVSGCIPDSWRTERAMMGGGLFIDRGIHAADLLINFAGMPEEVYAARLPQALQSLEGEDGMVVMARLQGGAIGLINQTWRLSKQPSNLWVSISGTRGSIYFEPDSSVLIMETQERKTTSSFPQDRRGLVSMIREFKESIENDRPLLTPGEEGLKALKIVLNAYESAARCAPTKMVASV